MEIMIDEKYRITSDVYCWILQEKKISNPNHHLSKTNTSKERWIDVGYYRDLDHLIKSLLERKLRQEHVNTLNDLKNTMIQIENKLKTKIDELLKQMKMEVK
ncbi:MAG TPA: hypothetical protein VIK94_01020 [Bacilli bacterium]